METYASILAWRIPWTGKPDGLQSMKLQSQTGLKRLGMRGTTLGGVGPAVGFAGGERGPPQLQIQPGKWGFMAREQGGASGWRLPRANTGAWGYG